MDANGEVCLGLGLGLVLSESSQPQKKNKRQPFLDLSIPIYPNDHGAEFNSNSNSNLKLIRQDHEKQASMSSFSKEDDFSRKKLTLTRDQTTLLQDSFRQHTTLSTAQKQTLAEKSNLKPRQVEVWFQNRRARTKLKQTEVECEILKKNCERLSDENRRLKKEVLELRSSMKIEKRQPTPFCHRNQTAACVKSGTCRGGGEKQEAAAAAVLEVVQEP